MGIKLHIRQNFEQIGAIVEEMAPKQVHASADALAEAADQTAPVLSGAERSSFYVRTRDESGYAQAASDAMSQALTEGPAYADHVVVQDEVPGPMVNTVAYVASAVVHTDYQELGTSHMPAHPALVPGADYIREGFSEALAAILLKACNGAAL